MGRKQLFVNLISNIISFGTSLSISFILTPYLISSIGKEAYSFYPISNNFVSYMAIVSVALNSMAARYITIEIVKNKKKNAQVYFSSAFFANVIMSFLFLIPMILIVFFVDIFMDIPKNIVMDVKFLFSFVFLSMIINLLTTVFGISTFVTNRMDIKASIDIVQGILRAILFILFFTLFKPSIIYLGLVALILSCTNFVIQFIFTRKLLPYFKISLNSFNFLAVKELISSGIWNSINSLGSVLLMSISLLMANILIDGKASGDLAIVQTVPNLMTTIISTVYAVFLPRITHVYAKENFNDLLKEVKFSQKVLGLISTTPALLIIIFGEEFFRLWLPNENSIYLQGLSIISVLPFVVHGNMWTIYGLTVTANKLRVPSITLIIVSLLNIIGTYFVLSFTNIGLIAIPLLNTVVNIGYYLFFIPIYISRELNIMLSAFYYHIVKTSIFSSIFLIIGYFIKSHLEIYSWVNFFLWGSFLGIIGLLLNVLILLRRDDILKFCSIMKKN